jgi:lysophospholipase L1-like esterase
VSLGGSDPALVIVMLTVNDWRTGIDPAVYAANLPLIVDKIHANTTSDPSILFVAYPEPAVGSVFSGATYQSYVDAMSALADTSANYSFVNLGDYMPPPKTDTTSGYYLDTIHPNAAGHQRIADVIYDFIIQKV